MAGDDAELSGMKTAAWVLILCAVVGIVAIVMMFKQGTGKGLPAILLLVAGILPILFSSKAILGVPMVLGAVFAFLTKPSEGAAAQAPAAPE